MLAAYAPVYFSAVWERQWLIYIDEQYNKRLILNLQHLVLGDDAFYWSYEAVCNFIGSNSFNSNGVHC